MLRLIKNSAYVIYEWSHSMDEKLLKVTAQRMNEGNGQGLVSLDGALATLHDAEDRVRRIVSQRFDEAVQSDDLASIERLAFVCFTKYLGIKLGIIHKRCPTIFDPPSPIPPNVRFLPSNVRCFGVISDPPPIPPKIGYH